MKNILHEFALGNINPNDGTIPKDSPYTHVMQTITDCEQQLLDTLDDEAKKLFWQFSSAHMEANAISNNDKFIYGYRLGVLMTMGIFDNSKNPIFGGDLL